MASTSALAHASWIASPVVGGATSCAPAPFFRKSFSLNRKVQSAQLTITALGLYECEINGSRVGDEIFAPGWTEYTTRLQYQTYDVTGQLHEGENVLGVILGDGWYCGCLAWKVRRQGYGDRPRLLAQLEIVLADGSKMTVASDPSWKTTTGPILESDFLMGEIYDARLELGAWSGPGYNDAQWQSALSLPPETAPELCPRMGPPVRRLGEIQPISTRKVGASSYIFDLGQNFSGRVKVKIKSSRGQTIRLRFAEILNPDQSLYTENLRGAKSTDWYTCKGDEIETWEPRFTFHGFRYVEASDLGANDSIEVTGIVLHSDTPPTGTLRCSNELLNQLQHNIIWGQKSNFLEVPTDCPQRDERLGWTGDAQVFIRTAAFNMDVQGFFQKWIRDCRDAQRPNGSIPCVIPNVIAIDMNDGGPAWSDATIICPWTIYLCYADRSVLEDHFASMERFMDFLARDRSKGFIRSHPDVDSWGGFGDWLALDGGGRDDGITPKDLIGTAFYAYDADLMAKIATVLGKEDEAKKYRALHGEIVQAFRHRYVTPEGLVAAGTQTAYVLALHFELLTPETEKVAARELVRDIERREFHIATGFVGTPYILDVLEKHGHLDVAYKLLEQETFPSWLFPVKNGATTIWERWDGWTPTKGFQNAGMNSYNHYAYGAVGAWMVHSMAGLDLDPAEPGYQHVRFRPRPGGTITWAEAKLETKLGTAGIHWDLDASTGDLSLDLNVPKGSRASLEAPASHAAPGKEFGPGNHKIVLKKTKN
jgi:alpha-L-rhamnosidase